MAAKSTTQQKLKKAEKERDAACRAYNKVFPRLYAAVRAHAEALREVRGPKQIQ